GPEMTISLQVEQLVDQLRRVFERVVATFARRPAGEVDFRQRLADLGPVDVSLAQAAEAVLLPPVLHVQFDDPAAERADPVFGGAELAAVTDVEVRADPRGVDLVEVVGKLLRVFAEAVPDVLDQ